MATVTHYHLGGYEPNAPQQNRAELYDGGAGTYTAWDTGGAVTTSRALTVDETALLAAQDAATTATNNQATVEGKARTALTANAQDVTQDQAIITQAASITPASITNLTTAAAAIGKLAQAAAVQAQNDVNTKAELNALIRLALADYDGTS